MTFVLISTPGAVTTSIECPTYSLSHALFSLVSRVGLFGLKETIFCTKTHCSVPKFPENNIPRVLPGIGLSHVTKLLVIITPVPATCGDVTDHFTEFHQVWCLIWKFHAVYGDKSMECRDPIIDGRHLFGVLNGFESKQRRFSNTARSCRKRQWVLYLSGLGEGSNRDPKSRNSSAQMFALILALMRLPKGNAILSNRESGRTSPPDPLAICETSSCTAASTTLVGCTALVVCMAVRTAATMVDTSVSERLSSPVAKAATAWLVGVGFPPDPLQTELL